MAQTQDAEIMFKKCTVTTRGQAKKAGECMPLKVPSTNESFVVDREKLKQMQRDDESLQKNRERDVFVRGQAENSFEVKGRRVIYKPSVCLFAKSCAELTTYVWNK